MGRTFAYFAAFTGMGILYIGALLLAAFLLGQFGTNPSLRGGSPSPAAGTGPIGSIEIHAFDLGFIPDMVTVAQPGEYTVTFVNDGSLVHNLTFDNGTVIKADAHTSVTGKVTVPARGLNFQCSVLGHAAAGMVGMVMVLGGTAAGSAPPAPSPSATPRPPGPPDPGEPGFIAGTKASPRIISLAVTDLLLFDPTAVTVQQGETITFRIRNTGKAEHEFKVGSMKDVFADAESAPEVAGITPGTTRSLTFTFSGTGPYAYACHAPGHFENGMFGFVHVIPTSPWIGTITHPRMIVIRMDDHLEFVPSEVSVTPGETILFVLANIGSAATHEFQVGPADRVALDQVDGQIVVEVDKIEPHHVDFITYTFGGLGPYAYACHEPGHYEAGMRGIVDVTP
jgi:uncharacterized cupredoxin-like copper-binding protein